MLLLRSFALLLLSAAWLPAQNFVLSEFLAANSDGLLDEDGDASDWIEIFNASAAPASVAGWTLTDDAGEPAKWTLPDVTVPGHGFLIVFASGKDRTAPAGELHANFSLSRDGEYLVLRRPDGTAATEFAPAFPPQRAGMTYGLALGLAETTLLAGDAAGRWLVPLDGSLGTAWIAPSFDDTAWTSGAQGLGYDRADPGGETPVVADVTAPGDAIVATSSNSPGGEDVAKAIDNTSTTKYLNFDKIDAGFTVTPSVGVSVVTALRLTSANDAVERDPTSFALSGSHDGNNFTLIASGALPDFTARFQPVQVNFANNVAYAHYRLLFPTVRNAAAAVAVQIAEVEFLGTAGPAATGFDDLIGTDVGNALDGVAPGIHLRLPFTVANGSLPTLPALRVWYDDGFVAYLNGVEVARANAPLATAWNSLATADRSRADAVRSVRFDLAPFAHLFAEGANVLALHGLNEATDSEEFLLRAEIFDTAVQLGGEARFEAPTPGAANPGGLGGIVENPVASVERGFFTAPFLLELTTPTPDAAIRYTTDGSEPSATTGALWTAPLSLDRTTVLRAAAFREGWLASETVTHTYLFAADVVGQTHAGALADGLPASWNGQAADYGMDPRVTVQPAELLTLPSISIALAPDDMFGTSGLYSNPNSRGDNWERAISFEWLDPTGGETFQEGAGLRIQGGAFRQFGLTLKKSFRLIFREKYGAPKLRHSLFGPEAAAEADSIVLRANGNDAWKWGGSATQYIRDAFAMGTMRAMGNVVSHSTFAHLYINGHYWGVYNPAERPDAAFSATYHGGATESWDALNQDSVPDGNADAWNRLLAACNAGLTDDAAYQRIQGNNPDGTRNPSYEVLLDVDNLIDYMIMNLYIGNNDWPGRNHWYGINRDGEQGFQFYPWDSETAVGLNSGVSTDRTGVNTSVARPYAALRANASFRLRFADRVQRHFFNGGVLHAGQPAARYSALAAFVDAAIAGESARWGDQLGSTPFTREGHWRPQLNSLLTNYFPQRAGIVLGQFRAAGLFPGIDAPVFSQHGGAVPAGFALGMTAGAGAILYTTDGSDPRAAQTVEELGRTTLVDSLTPKRLLVPNAAVDDAWRGGAAFDDSTWTAGTGGVGYETSSGYESYIGIDVEGAMAGQRTSALVRVAFDHQPSAGVNANFLTLRVRCDDGFAAFLNGTLVASQNAPAALAWNSQATGSTDDAAAVQWREFAIDASLPALRTGANVLALHALNAGANSSDFLIDAQLEVGERRVTGDTGTAHTYVSPLTLGDLVTVRARALSGGVWSALTEATFVVGTPRLVISELDYHPAPPSAAETAAGFTDGDDFEFVELHNPSAFSFDLRGVRFVDGVEFDFTGSAVEVLPPGGRVLVVNKADAFAARHGAGLPVAGEYTGRLANDGEHLEVVDAAGATLISFTYSDDAPWPAGADGAGHSLELRDADADAADGSNWSASHGAPTPAAAPESRPARSLAVALEDGDVVLSFSGEKGARYVVWQSDDLAADWTVTEALPPATADGTVEVRLPRSPETTRRYYRIVTE